MIVALTYNQGNMFNVIAAAMTDTSELFNGDKINLITGGTPDVPHIGGFLVNRISYDGENVFDIVPSEDHLRNDYQKPTQELYGRLNKLVSGFDYTGGRYDYELDELYVLHYPTDSGKTNDYKPLGNIRGLLAIVANSLIIIDLELNKVYIDGTRHSIHERTNLVGALVYWIARGYDEDVAELIWQQDLILSYSPSEWTKCGVMPNEHLVDKMLQEFAQSLQDQMKELTLLAGFLQVKNGDIGKEYLTDIEKVEYVLKEVKKNHLI